MSVCAKLQLSSWSRSGWIVCVGWGGGGEHVATMSNSNAFAELRWVLTIQGFGSSEPQTTMVY